MVTLKLPNQKSVQEQIKKLSNHQLLPLYLIILASFLIRVNNLNYNSPFNDEAIYIVIGKMELFENDWSYNAISWMAGHPFFYPIISAVASIFGNVVGSRMLNVIFGVLAIEATYIITYSLSPLTGHNKTYSGLIAASILGGSSISLYVSRLATYDMPSFYFLILGIFLLILAPSNQNSSSKKYFFSAITLLVGFFTKNIIAIYFPFLLLYSYLQAKKIPNMSFFWKRYFLPPLIVTLGVYFLIYLQPLTIFYKLQAQREFISNIQILQTFWANSQLEWIIWSLSTIGFLIYRDFKKWIILTLLSLVILVSHLLFHRLSTFDKHIYLTIFFLSIASGLGLSYLGEFLERHLPKVSFWYLGIFTTLAVFWGSSYLNAQRFNSLWVNNTDALNELSKMQKPGDKVLAESGAAAILASYNKNLPTNITTFDYFRYQSRENDQAYINALNDGYFNLVELEDNNVPKSDLERQKHNLISKNLSNNYSLLYEKGNFLIYRRNF